jgi:6-pyruvoyltetrahydropterin/6-carboxytetrahydropterin synthase
MITITATKIFEFASAHSLFCEEGDDDMSKLVYGKCTNLHGHNYTLEVTVSTSNLIDGMVINFSKLKEIVNDLIISKLDHKMLNDINKEDTDFPIITTAENMASYIFNKLNNHFYEQNDNSMWVSRIRLYETPTSYVECIGR